MVIIFTESHLQYFQKSMEFPSPVSWKIAKKNYLFIFCLLIAIIVMIWFKNR